MNNNIDNDDNKKIDKPENKSTESLGGKEREKKTDESYTYYYNREERLKKLKTLVAEKKRPGIFKKGNKRTLLVILIDILLVSLFIYFINRPTSFYKSITMENTQYELNVSGIRGKRVMFAVTITNRSNTNIEISRGKQIILNIKGNNEREYNFKKQIGENTELKPGESTSIVFMIKENELPKSGDVNIYIGDNKRPVFSTKIRFYYFSF